MFWWLLFGGIVIFAVLLYARLGLVLWRKGVALFEELERARMRLDTVLPALTAATEGSPPDRWEDSGGSRGSRDSESPGSSTNSTERSRPTRARRDVRERAE